MENIFKYENIELGGGMKRPQTKKTRERERRRKNDG